MVLKTIKMIIKMENIEKGFKFKMISLGILEQIVNSYKTILKLPFYLIGLPFCFIGWLSEQIADLCSLAMGVIHEIPYIKLCKKEDREKLIKAIREINTYKVS